MKIDIIRIILFFGLLLFTASIAYIIYKILSKKIEKGRKNSEILMTTEEGRMLLKEQENKRKLFAKIIFPILFVLFLVILIISIFGTIFCLKNIYDKGFENIEVEDLKLLVYLGMAIYFTLIIYGFVKRNK